MQDLTLKDNQHAFLKGRSTISALIEMTQKWFDETENAAHGRKGIHAIFIDFNKAFYMVDHRILLSKLASMNLTKSFWLCFRDFLSMRSQQVKLLQTLSSPTPCPAGVPQGSVISPILFNVYIDDLENEISANLNVDTSKYADDCTPDQAVGAEEISHTQQALDITQSWSVLNKMTINVQKTKDMWICFTESVSEPPPVYIGDEQVERMDKFKLLGMGLQNNLKWNNHVETAIQKANRQVYILRECRKANLPIEVGITLYKSNIISILEFASFVWSGLPTYLANEIERTQTRCLRVLGYNNDCLQSLSDRREELLKREARKIMNDPSHPLHTRLFKSNNPYDLRTISSKNTLSRIERHKRSFLARASALT